MSYVEEPGASSPRRSRRRRALVTLAVVSLMLFFAFWYAYSYYRHSDTRHAAATPVCTTKPAAPTPADVTLNVYNSTDRAGLAAMTAGQLRKRGFKVATVANDPLQRKIPGTAEVRYGATAIADSKLVLTLVKGAKGVRDGRPDASVDLVLGEKFTALAAPPKTPKPTTTTASPTSTCQQPGADAG